MSKLLSRIDKVLLVSLFFGLIFSLYGIHWGWVEDWHPDQMAFRRIFNEGTLPFNPESFYKPPFHTYFNFFFSTVPFYIIKKILHLSTDSIVFPRLIWSRMLIIFLFLGSITLVFQISRRFFGNSSARIITGFFATSAGIIAFNHFMTADIPVMFWMLVSFYFAQNILLRGSVRDYTLAGFFTGIATATKYNGLGVGIAVLAAHILSSNSLALQRMFWDRKLFIGLSMIVIGFLVANPFAALDHSMFISDFMYNNLVTPVYSGVTTGHGYGTFFLCFVKIIGLPSFLLFSITILISGYLLFTSKLGLMEKKAMLLLISVFLLYYYKIGSFPRLPSRFVLPIIPFWLIMSGPFWQRIKVNQFLVSGFLIILLSYNVMCSFYVGKRFSEDPRMIAQTWIKENITENSSIESTSYTPHWNLITGISIEDKRMPSIHGRGRLLGPLFKDNPWASDLQEEIEKEDKEEQWYSHRELMIRSPDYIAIDSLYYDRFTEEKNGRLYPHIRQFFDYLLSQKYPYKIVFDQESKNVPSWIYPQEIDFLHNRITIFQKVYPFSS